MNSMQKLVVHWINIRDQLPTVDFSSHEILESETPKNRTIEN